MSALASSRTGSGPGLRRHGAAGEGRAHQLKFASAPGIPWPAPGAIPGDVSSLYVHIPFCERKCEYCDFASVAGLGGEERYVAALASQIRALGEALPGTSLETVFFGGGTPGFLPPRLLEQVIGAVLDSFSVQPSAEVTMEANPSSTNLARARQWKAMGFNRISLGIQALDDSVLRFLGRVHSARSAVAAVADVQGAGFDNVNCDLIYAVPGLTRESLCSSVSKLLELAPAHISAYELTIESGTPLSGWARANQARIPLDAESCDQHWMVVDQLADAGYGQYEVSNFARPGMECRHNLNYWRNGYYLAVGTGAHGHLSFSDAAAAGLVAGAGNAAGAGSPVATGGGYLPRSLLSGVEEKPQREEGQPAAVRYWHVSGIGAYCSLVEERRQPVVGLELTGNRQQSEERLLSGLRLNCGVPAADLPEPRVADLVDAGLLQYVPPPTVSALGPSCSQEHRPAPPWVAVTRRGQELLNLVVSELSYSLDGAADQ